MFLTSDGVAAPGRRPGFSLRPGLGAGRGGGGQGERPGRWRRTFSVATVGGHPSGGPARFLLSAPLPRPGKFKSWRRRAIQSPGDEIPGVWALVSSPPAAACGPGVPRKPQALTPFFQTPAARPPTSRGRRGQDGSGPVPPGAGSKPMARAGRGPLSPAAPAPYPLGRQGASSLQAWVPRSRPPPASPPHPPPASPPPRAPGVCPQPAPTPSRRCSPARPPEPRGRLARLSALACPACVPHPVAGASCENQIWPCLPLPHTRPRPCGTPHPSWETDQACRAPPRPTGPPFPLHTLPRSSLTLNSTSGLPTQAGTWSPFDLKHWCLCSSVF